MSWIDDLRAQVLAEEQTAVLVMLAHVDGHAVRYLQVRPYDKAWGWFASDMRHATPVSAALGDRLAAIFRVNGDRVAVIDDPRRRPVFDDVALMQQQIVEGR